MSAAAAEAPRTGIDPQRLLVGLGLLPVGGVLVFGLGLLLGVEGDDIFILGLAVLTGTLAAVPPAIEQARAPAERHLILALLALANIVFFVTPVFFEYFLADPTRQYSVLALPSLAPRDIIKGQLGVLLGLSSLFVGYFLGRAPASLLPKPRYDWSESVTLRVVAVLLPVAWLVFLAGLFGLMPSGLGTGVFSFIRDFVFFGLSMLALAYLRYRSRTAFLLLVVLVPITMFFNFFTGSKGRFLGPLIYIALAYVVYERRVRITWLAGGFLLVILFFPVANFYRNVLTQGLTVRPSQMLTNPGRVFSAISKFVSTAEPADWFAAGAGAATGRFNGLGILSLIMRDTPERVPYQGGWTIGNVFLAYIPRAIWPDKPSLTIGQWTTDTYTGSNTKTSTGCTWIGEFYLNFGWAGIALGMTVIGMLVRSFHEILMRGRSTIPALVGSVIVVNMTARKLGGALHGPVNVVVFSLVPLLFVHLAVRFLSGGSPSLMPRIDLPEAGAGGLPGSAPESRGSA